MSLNINPDSIVPVITGTILVTTLTIFIVLFVILYRKAQLRFQLEKQEFQQALLQTEVEIREQTLNDISRDLHDNFGQVASLIKINLNMISKDQKNEDRERIEESINLLKKLIEEMRVLSRSLNPGHFREKGLIQMILADAGRINRSGFLKVAVHTQLSGLNLNFQVSLFIYRMFQEMMNNILKHSEATTAVVHISETKHFFSLQVEDNGKGISNEILENIEGQRMGSGLANIRTRCKIIHATCVIERSAAKGTFIEIKLPNSTNHDGERSTEAS